MVVCVWGGPYLCLGRDDRRARRRGRRQHIKTQGARQQHQAHKRRLHTPSPRPNIFQDTSCPRVQMYRFEKGDKESLGYTSFERCASPLTRVIFMLVRAPFFPPLPMDCWLRRRSQAGERAALSAVSLRLVAAQTSHQTHECTFVSLQVSATTRILQSAT